MSGAHVLLLVSATLRQACRRRGDLVLENLLLRHQLVLPTRPTQQRRHVPFRRGEPAPCAATSTRSWSRGTLSSGYAGDYNRDRPHRTLHLETPQPRERPRAGPAPALQAICARPVLDGLHHAYEAAAT